jgi:hypothetical protein
MDQAKRAGGNQSHSSAISASEGGGKSAQEG